MSSRFSSVSARLPPVSRWIDKATTRKLNSAMSMRFAASHSASLEGLAEADLVADAGGTPCRPGLDFLADDDERLGDRQAGLETAHHEADRLGEGALEQLFAAARCRRRCKMRQPRAGEERDGERPAAGAGHIASEPAATSPITTLDSAEPPRPSRSRARRACGATLRTRQDAAGADVEPRRRRRRGAATDVSASSAQRLSRRASGALALRRLACRRSAKASASAATTPSAQAKMQRGDRRRSAASSHRLHQGPVEPVILGARRGNAAAGRIELKLPLSLPSAVSPSYW